MLRTPVLPFLLVMYSFVKSYCQTGSEMTQLWRKSRGYIARCSLQKQSRFENNRRKRSICHGQTRKGHDKDEKEGQTSGMAHLFSRWPRLPCPLWLYCLSFVTQADRQTGRQAASQPARPSSSSAPPNHGSGSESHGGKGRCSPDSRIEPAKGPVRTESKIESHDPSVLCSYAPIVCPFLCK